MSEAACGIDFGTTNSAIAIVRNGLSEVLRVSNGIPQELLRSVVYFDRGEPNCSRFDWNSIASF